jgi:hypothetical protein
MSKKQRAPLLPPTTVGPVLSRAPGTAVEFSPYQMPPEQFDNMKGAPDFWTLSCGSLLRAARTLWQPASKEFLSSGNGYTVADQAFMLAAMACEAALKALIAARQPALASTTPGKLPDDLKGHDLEELAGRATYVAADDHGRQAIKYGRFFIEIVGRYPTGTVAENTPANMMRTAQLFPAYEAIALACVEAAILERHKNPAFAKVYVTMFNDQATPPA